MLPPWEAGSDVVDLFNAVKAKHHHPRLEIAKLAISFVDTKPFIKGRFNWGKVRKFRPQEKLWHAKSFDFEIILCGDVWHDILNMTQREALADLHLERLDVEYEPEYEVDAHGKKGKPVKDEWGRVQYSGNVKYDDDGVPRWKIHSLDLPVFASNARRYGIWCEDLLSIKKAVEHEQPILPTVIEISPEAPEFHLAAK